MAMRIGENAGVIARRASVSTVRTCTRLRADDVQFSRMSRMKELNDSRVGRNVRSALETYRRSTSLYRVAEQAVTFTKLDDGNRVSTVKVSGRLRLMAGETGRCKSAREK